MSTFLIQVSGYSIHDADNPRYVAGAKGPRFCDEPLKHGEYFNASPFWQREGYGRRDAWYSISRGDDVLLYCSGSVDEHGACISHLLTVGDVTLDESDGARLEFSAVQELSPKISYKELQEEMRADRLSDHMNYCGQEGFNIAEIPESDATRVLELARPVSAEEGPTESHPDESLARIADDYFGE